MKLRPRVGALGPRKVWVWLLEEVDYDYQHLVGIFSSRRKAFECKRKHKMIMKGAELVVLPYEMDREYTIDWSEVGKKDAREK